ncbi:MAG TPA: cyclase family protein [Alphaproteobacteria bacterium]|jgi:kynurenine formamidase|nr:cyclase family protein [Alphaproteobacteria bacterium]MDP7429556.1 cyclase family protein [Alphaproteobacteria bacterium]HJM50961.1 cyclase family protein [Alphaproteobacteria bacterium]
MTKIVDLSVAIEDHLRWPVDRKLLASHDEGSNFQVTYVGGAVHGFTHMDAPIHFVAGGATSSEVALEKTVGEAAMVDLRPIAENTEITTEALAARAGHVGEGDIVLLKTCWDEQREFHTPEFWTTAPYLSRGACEWLLERGIRALGVDFPQDYPIRGLLSGEMAPTSEYVSHDVLLRNGVILIEYLCNMGALEQDRVMLVALPLKLPESDGAPSRVIALLD